MPNTYVGRRQVVFSPVISSRQPQSDPGTGCGTPIVSTTGFPLANWNARRAAIRRIVRGAAKDLLMRLNAILSGGGAQGFYAVQPAGETVPTGSVLVQHAQLVLLNADQFSAGQKRLSSRIRGWSHFVETVRFRRGVRVAHRAGHRAVRSRRARVISSRAMVRASHDRDSAFSSTNPVSRCGRLQRSRASRAAASIGNPFA